MPSYNTARYSPPPAPHPKSLRFKRKKQTVWVWENQSSIQWQQAQNFTQNINVVSCFLFRSSTGLIHFMWCLRQEICDYCCLRWTVLKTCAPLNGRGLKQAGQAIYTFAKWRSRKKWPTDVSCSTLNACLSFSCRNNATLNVCALPTHCDLASRSGSSKRAWASMPCIGLPSCQVWM